MADLGTLSIRNFKPKTVKKGKKTTTRKKELQEAFVNQNKNLLSNLQEKCKGKRLSLSHILPYENRFCQIHGSRSSLLSVSSLGSLIVFITK
jgi:hypothetical protein